MATHRPFLVPLSIVAGSAIIATGLYLGLSERRALDAEPDRASTRVAPTAFRDDTPQGGGQSPPAPSGPSEDIQKAVADAAGRALESTKDSEFLPRCWLPAVGQAPDPPRSVYDFQMTFDAKGLEIARGISELREVPSRSDVANCLRLLPIGLTVPAPGHIVQVVVRLELP